VDVAGANFHHAGLDIELFEGSIDGVEPGIADVAVGNISPEWIASLAREWVRVIKPRGTVLLSGIEANDVARVEERLKSAGLGLQDIRAENEWRALVLTPIDKIAGI
jgi:ribosomal protein L11 methylase PrmA